MIDFLVTRREAWPFDTLNLEALSFVLDESDAELNAFFQKTTIPVPDNIAEIIKEEYDLVRDDLYVTLLRPSPTPSGLVAPQSLMERVGGEPSSECKWIAAFAGPALTGLRLFRRDHDEELISVSNPAQATHGSSSMVVVDLQCAPEQLYFSSTFPQMATGTSYLAMVLIAIKSQKRETLRLEDYFQTALASSPNEVFVEESFCKIPCFHPKVASCLLDALEQSVSARQEQQLVGPMDYRHYHRLDLSTDAPSIYGVSVLSILASDAFRQLISQVSGLDLVGLSLLEGRRITKDDYQIFNDRYSEPHGLDVVITLLSSPDDVDLAQDGGSLLYLVDGEQVASIQPRHNTMTVAYRVKGCNRFMPLLCELPRKYFQIFQFHQTFVVRDD